MSLKSINILRHISLIFIIGMVGCLSEDRGVDHVFSSSRPCIFPCWQEIIPNKTTLNEAKSYLISSGLTESRLITEGFGEYETNNHLRRLDVSTKNEFEINFIFDEIEVVQVIEFNTEYLVTIGEFIQKYGQPSGISLTEESGEYVCFQAILYYPDMGLQIEGMSCSNGTSYQGGFFTIRDDLPIRFIRLAPPTNTSQELRDSIYLIKPPPSGSPIDIVPWQGFQGYKVDYYR